jgi:hypothetical protein
MDADEVLRLKQNSGIAEIFKDTDYSHSWEPTDGDITHQERGNPPHQTRT